MGTYRSFTAIYPLRMDGFFLPEGFIKKTHEQMLQYPIGTYTAMPFSETLRRKWLADLRYLPLELERSLLNLDAEQLHSPYRPGAWTVHQLVHHVADSHINAFCRFKVALSEDWPLIKPYDENAWVAQADVASTPVNTSITLLHALHERFTALAEAVQLHEWETKGVLHPVANERMSAWYLLGLYAWHGRHHTAQILQFREAINR